MENSTICIRQTKGFPNFCCTSLVRVEEYWEIVLHLIYRTNIGVSHNVVGRKKRPICMQSVWYSRVLAVVVGHMTVTALFWPCAFLMLPSFSTEGLQLVLLWTKVHQ